MEKTLDIPMLLGLAYAFMIVYTMFRLAVNYDDLGALIICVLAAVWPLTYFAIFFTNLLQANDDRKTTSAKRQDKPIGTFNPEATNSIKPRPKTGNRQQTIDRNRIGRIPKT